MDIIVIGAGPAGMMAAGTAAEQGARVMLLEKMEKPGRKLAITGKGRCNITNLKDWESFSPHVHPLKRYFKPVFYKFTSEDTVKFFNDIGLPTVLERGTRVYPASQRAFDVIDAMKAWLERLGVQIIYNSRVVEFITEGTLERYAEDNTENPAERYAEDNTGNPAEGKASGTVKGSSVQMADEVRIQSSVAKAADSANTKNANPLRIKAVKVADANGQIRCINADHFILATGGMSYPGTGSTGDGYPLASALGHTIEPLFPTLTALMPVNYDRRLEGIQLRNVRLDLYTEQVLRRSEEGELFFTNLGIEGPIGFRVSRQAVVALNKGQRVALHLNLKPALNREQLMARWEREDMPDPSCRVGDAVGGAGGSAGGSAVGGAAGSAARSAAWTAVGAKSRAEAGIRNDRAKDAKVQAGAGSAGPDLPLRLKRYMPEALIAPFTKYLAESGLHPVDGMLSWVFPIASYGDWARAVVTAGGISMKEIDLQTMRSKVVANLSVAGEVLDLDADSGGYNLQIAFATGRVAGKHSNGV
ncbi:MAG: NAD(P)/FAD-dependent oxidoreductase [Bacteroidales bacterium]|nr:NAD(P)/FAD-dependent oxidoreductase [Bacteroidales bacterium]MDD4500131.1 NAD(P)/FAD-dependent oxidoreductase [Bacteroidales bacterium]